MKTTTYVCTDDTRRFSGQEIKAATPEAALAEYIRMAHGSPPSRNHGVAGADTRIQAWVVDPADPDGERLAEETIHAAAPWRAEKEGDRTMAMAKRKKN